MVKSTQKLAAKLLSTIITTKELKEVSDLLEDLTQSKSFRDHADSILTDPDLSESQKKTQLQYLMRSVEHPILYTFFSDSLDDGHLWLFSSSKTDYFNRFVATFQKTTEDVEVIKLTTAINIEPKDLYHISKSLSEFLGMHVVISHTVKPALIGGIELSIENISYDFSLRNKFTTFKHEWLKLLDRTEKAIGRNQIDTI